MNNERGSETGLDHGGGGDMYLRSDCFLDVFEHKSVETRFRRVAVKVAGCALRTVGRLDVPLTFAWQFRVVPVRRRETHPICVVNPFSRFRRVAFRYHAPATEMRGWRKSKNVLPNGSSRCRVRGISVVFI